MTYSTALRYLCFMIRMCKEVQVRVCVKVDEARAQNVPLGFYLTDLGTKLVGESTRLGNTGDTAPRDEDIGEIWLCVLFPRDDGG